MVAKSVLANLKSKAPPKPPEKAAEKTAAAGPVPGAAKPAPAAAGKPPTKPDDKDPKGAKPVALPDAALLDDEAGDGDAAAAAPRHGLAAWLPTGRKRWFVLSGGAGGLLAIVAAAAVVASHLLATPPPPPKPTTISGPAKAVDGATMTVGGQMVHLEDVDAPPATLICRDGAWKYNCGAESRRALDEAIGDAPVECVNPHPDPAGHLAALCRNDTGLDLAAIQVESGWAVDDMRTSSRYIAEESQAENGGKGLWRNDFAHPELWRGSPAETPKDSPAHPR